MKNRTSIAEFVCMLIGLVSVVIYLHIFLPTESKNNRYEPVDNEYRFERKCNDVYMTFVYIGKENDPALEIEDIGFIGYRQNLIIPGYVEKDSVTYKVLSVTEEYSVDCDTLFIPATVEYFNYDKILDKCCADVNYIIVEPGNKYYKSVDGNLFRGDSLVFDVRAVYHNKSLF
ncbi:MAG: hypothetical protein IKW77_09425 [Salinivirgaceae bacterium]|nr:hypothetical protein [Salinivirgaceae bacterium]